MMFELANMQSSTKGVPHSNLPVTHATHAVETDEPVAAFDVPAAQATHAVDAVDAVAVLYLPATHDVQRL